jgi:restriction system protein
MGFPNYTNLLTYWYSVIIYDRIVEFCKRWIKSWKLSEQMTGAARAGKQNIVEGSEAFATSLKTVIKLTNVSRFSIEELIGDLEDFLRQSDYAHWSPDDPRIIEFRKQNAQVTGNLRTLRDLRNPKTLKVLKSLELPKDPEEAANFLLTLCNQASSLLRKQVAGLEKKHRNEGGYTEKLYNQRRKYRGY